MNNEIKWFMQQQGQVQGPYLTQYLRAALQNLDSQLLENTWVWRRGLAEWIKASKWKPDEHVQQPSAPPPRPASFTIAPESRFNENTQATKTMAPPPPPSGTTEATNPTSAFYRVQVNFVDQPLMSKSDLLNLIAKQEDVSVISIQDQQTKEWKEIYAFPDIVDTLGLSRRKYPRVPILAQFQGKTNRHEQFFARVITISEGGLGLTENYDLKIGDDLEGLLTSPHFFQPIHFRGDVVYAGLDGYIGVSFTQINDESKAAVIDYIKKFGKTSSNGNL